MRVLKNKAIVFVLIFTFGLLRSATAQTVKYSNEFLSIGVGARALAMSGAVVASNENVYAAYWNPANLTHLTFDRSIALMHSEYFAGIAKYEYGAFAAKFNNQSAGAISMVRFAVDDIPNTSELIDGQGNINYDKVSSFSSADYAFILSYGRLTKIEGLRWGTNFKIIHRKVGDFGKGWGFGLDFGLSYKRNNWSLAFMGRDITTTFNSWSYELDEKMKETFTRTGNTIPVNSTEITLPKFIFAGTYYYAFGKNFGVLGELNMDLTTDGQRNVLISSKAFNLDPHLGLEFDYKKMVFLRTGIGNFQKVSDPIQGTITSFQPTIGIGVVIRQSLSIDYAFTDIGNQSIALYSNVISLHYSFNSKKN
jgi:hypothetical protein